MRGRGRRARFEPSVGGVRGEEASGVGEARRDWDGVDDGRGVACGAEVASVVRFVGGSDGRAGMRCRLRASRSAGEFVRK